MTYQAVITVPKEARNLEHTIHHGSVFKLFAFVLVALAMTGRVWAGSPNLPAAPSNLAATGVSPSQINLSWQDNSGNESGFNIERAPTSAGTWTQIATVGANVTTYANSGLNAATTYYYRVLAYNSKGNSSYSGVASATTQPAASCTYTISASSSPSGSGSVSGGGVVACNSSVTVAATPNSGYNFVNWTEGATVVSTS